ncbi:hypothetical protein [Acinetobacter baumannii]|uniref:hypothetical protein n=1 Tax=Acinetobacter baumannii TaxID=470 RepID=UPI000FAF03E6|nr:hypothetical protein [Acinetobacter baumannii]RUT38464.1 hypothetical protein EM030_16355 [Acinetobacter baumannii]
MKPEQFIREQGLPEAKRILGRAPEGATHYELTVDGGFYFKRESFDWFCFGGGELIRTYMEDHETCHLMPLNDLKRLVESVDLVKKLGGRSGAIREYFEYVHSGKSELDIRPNELARAIKDHESIYGGGDE